MENIEHGLPVQNNERLPVESMFPSSYVMPDAVDGLSHVTNLLSMLVDITMEAATSQRATPAFQDYLIWMLDSFLLVHETQRRWQANHMLFGSSKQSSILSIGAVQALLSSLGTSLSATVIRKGSILMSILCADFLEDMQHLNEQHPSQVQTLCSTLLNLASVCWQYYSVSREVSLHLVPKLQTLLNDEEDRSFLNKDLRVCS